MSQAVFEQIAAGMREALELIESGALDWDGKTAVHTHEVIKHHKRLYIRCNETGELVYTPPDFLRPYIRNREGLKKLARRLNYEWFKPIGAIMDFEASFW